MNRRKKDDQRHDSIVCCDPAQHRQQEQFTIDLPRPRDINTVSLAQHATVITRALKRHLQPELTEAAE